MSRDTAPAEGEKLDFWASLTREEKDRVFLALEGKYQAGVKKDCKEALECSA